MKAAVHTRYGPPEVVAIAEVDTPTVNDDELLVRVHAATVNRTDAAYRAAKPFVVRSFTGLTKPKVTILGTEFAGEVEAIGREVTTFEVGDRVFGYIEGAFGAHAEYLTVPGDGSVAMIPEGSAFDDVVAATEGAHYALAFIDKADVKSGQDVLVNGATGAIGSAAVQLLKSVGANVTAVCATDHVALVEGLGADRVIDYTVDDFTEDEQSFDLVIDAVGKSTFGRCRRLLKPGGIYVSSELGPFVQNPILALITPLLRGKRVVFPIPKDDQQMIGHFKRLIESGEFTPVIDGRYPLDQIVEAYHRVESGQKVGSVVISIE